MAADTAAFGVDVVTFTSPVLLLITDELSVSLALALFTFEAVTFGLFAAELTLFKAMISILVIRLRSNLLYF